MGYSLSWLAIKGMTPEVVLEGLGFRTTGERQGIPEAPLSAARLPNGWYLIVSNCAEQVASDSVLEHQTSKCEAVTCFVEEHVMFSCATGWKSGRRCWSINHDAQRGIEHLATEGELPASFVSIREGLFLKQKEDAIRKAGKMACDYIFDIPVEAAREITGYRYDRHIPGLNGEPFEVLIDAAPKDSGQQQKPSLWRRLFG